jgi:hypothetical protein
MLRRAPTMLETGTEADRIELLKLRDARQHQPSMFFCSNHLTTQKYCH